MIAMRTKANIRGTCEKSLTKQICLFVFALSLAACVSTHYDPAATSKIKSGVTTAAELELWFGKPHERRPLSGGGEKLVWQYFKGAAPRTVEKYWLFVTTGADGRVKSFGQSWYVGNR